MDGLSKSQKDEYATTFAILALYDGGADITTDQINALLEATGNTEVEPFYPIIFSSFLTPAKLGSLIAMPSAGGGGGGGAAAGGDAAEAEEEKVEEKPEEEEMDLGGGMSMFGEEEGGGGDY